MLNLDFEKLRKEYILELAEKFELIEKSALELDKSDQKKRELLLREISALTHSIKGGAGSYEMDAISQLCHQFEDYLINIQIDDNNLSNQTLSFVDNLKKLSNDYYNGKQPLALPAQPMLVDKSIFKSKKALVVEDSKTIMMTYKETLNQSGYCLSIASSGTEALVRLENEKFDLVISGATTKNISGRALLAACRYSEGPNKHTPFVIATSQDFYELPKEFSTAYVLTKDASLKSNLLQLLQKLESKKILNKIIYVDDDEALHKLVKVYLQKQSNLDVVYSRSGKEAIQALNSSEFDLILLDVEMPDENGIEVFKKIKKDSKFKNIPLFFMTGRNSEADINELLGLGAQAVISKPFSAPKLYQQILDKYQNI